MQILDYLTSLRIYLFKMNMVVPNISGLGAILPFTISATPLSGFNFDRLAP